MTKAKEDLGGAQALDPPSRHHCPLTALERSDTSACCPGAFQQAGPLSKQRKRRHGRAPGQLPPPAPNFVPSPLLHPVSRSPLSTPRSRAASRRSSRDLAPALAISAHTRRISNPNDSCALAVMSQKPENTSSSTALSTPPRLRLSPPPSN